MNSASLLRPVVFILLFLVSCHASNVPSNGLTLSLVNSSSNLGSLGWPPWFRINAAITHDRGPPMNDIAVYMNAVTAMEDLCFMDQGADLHDRLPRTWSLPQYDLSIDVWTAEVRFAVWALQLTVAVSYNTGYWPVIGKIMWHEAPEGRWNFQYRRESKSSTIIGNPGDLSLNSSAANSPNTTTDFEVSLTAGELRVIPRYNGASMSTYAVFSRVLAAMGVGADTGPEETCAGISGINGLEITPELDDQGQSLLKYRQLIKAMRIVSRWMVAKKRFGEIDFELERDGVKIAQGRMGNFRSQSLASL